MRSLLSLLAIVALCACNRADSSQLVVTDFGARPDTTTLSTAAIQAAIDRCAAQGGGQVVVPTGDYLVGTLYMRDNVELHLAHGATLYASRDTAVYSHVALGGADVPRQEVVIMAQGLRNIAITGTGRIHCQAVRESFQREPVDTTLPLTDFITGREVRNAAKYRADYLTKYRKVPPCPTAVNITDCRDVTLQDFQIEESSSWGLHLQWCQQVAIRSLRISSSLTCGVNSDGIDIDGCQRVTISDCHISTGDDGLCLKTTRHGDQAQPCQDIAITNCVLTSSSSAFKLGTESHADFERITMSNCVITHANRGINFTIRDGGNARDIVFTNIVINTERKAPFWWGNGDPVWLITQRRKDAAHSGSISNVVFSHILAHSQSGVRVEGFDGDISNVRFYDFQLWMEPEQAVDKRARDAFLVYKARDIRLTDCAVHWSQLHQQPEWECAYRFDQVNGLGVSGCTVTGQPAAHKSLSITACKNTDIYPIK